MFVFSDQVQNSVQTKRTLRKKNEATKFILFQRMESDLSIDFEQLTSFQGDFAYLSEINYEQVIHKVPRALKLLRDKLACAGLRRGLFFLKSLRFRLRLEFECCFRQSLEKLSKVKRCTKTQVPSAELDFVVP